jgi:hypothetical protein
VLKHQGEIAVLTRQLENCNLTIRAYEGIYQTYTVQNASTIETVGNVGVSRAWLRLDSVQTRQVVTTTPATTMALREVPMQGIHPLQRDVVEKGRLKKLYLKNGSTRLPKGSEFSFMSNPFRAWGKHDKQFIRSLHKAAYAK